MPDLPPEPVHVRRPEQLTLRAPAFVELLFVAPARARKMCWLRRPAPDLTPLREAREVADLLTWRPPARREPPARARSAEPRPEAPLRTSRPAPRARVVQPKPLTTDERVELRAIERELRGPAYRGLPIVKPTHRSECVNVPRPCPFVSCAHNNFLEVQPPRLRRSRPGHDGPSLLVPGAIKYNVPNLEPGEMDPTLSCAHDIQDRQGVPLEVVGAALNVSMERARQLVDEALAKGKAVVRAEDVEFEVDES